MRRMDPSLVPTMNFVADFGELVAIAPPAVVLGLFLLFQRQRALAMAWFGGLGWIVASAALLKSEHLPVSGHAAVALFFEGGLAVLLWRGALGFGAGARVVSGALAALAAAVPVSVYLLRWHSLADVVSGISLGLLSCACVAHAPLRAPKKRGYAVGAIAVTALLVAALHGVRLNAQAEHRFGAEVTRTVFGIGPAAARSR